MGDHVEPPARDTRAPFGAPVPRIYRKHPEEALTAQAYFYLFWWYRASLLLFIVGTASLVAAVALLFTGAANLAAGIGVVAVALQVIGGFGWVFAAVDAHGDKMALYVDTDGSPT